MDKKIGKKTTYLIKCPKAWEQRCKTARWQSWGVPETNRIIRLVCMLSPPPHMFLHASWGKNPGCGTLSQHMRDLGAGGGLQTPYYPLWSTAVRRQCHHLFPDPLHPTWNLMVEKITMNMKSKTKENLLDQLSKFLDSSLRLTMMWPSSGSPETNKMTRLILAIIKQ